MSIKEKAEMNEILECLALFPEGISFDHSSTYR